MSNKFLLDAVQTLNYGKCSTRKYVDLPIHKKTQAAIFSECCGMVFHLQKELQTLFMTFFP